MGGKFSSGKIRIFEHTNVEPQGSFQIIAVMIEEEVVKLVAPSSDKMKPGDKLSLSFVEERLISSTRKLPGYPEIGMCH